MYFFIAPIFFIKQKSKTTILVVVCTMLLFLFIGRIFFMEQLKTMHVILMLDFWVNFAILFMIGALLSIVEIEKIPYKIPVILVAILLLVLCLPLSNFEYIQYLLLPIIVILMGSTYLKPLSFITEKLGDISYGTYIYGFLLQQLVMHFFKLNALELLLVSLPLTLFFGWLSWHLIEKYALSKKQVVYQKIKQFLN
jgi:peptidoglycan/LPS O-acetylase OafA/YrhL